MEPTLTLPPHLADVLNELQALEPVFHAAHPNATPADFERLVSPDFWEVGATGRRYSRAFALQVLRDRHGHPDPATWITDEFHVQQAGDAVYLLTYRLKQPGRVTRRLTVWRRELDHWLAIYHQGTVVSV